MSAREGYIHSTESFGTVDGPGLRFVVFLAGCPMRCLYCHNPDTWEMSRGTPRTVEDLLSEYEGVRTLLRDGGITCTGGEPLVQIEFVTELFEAAKERGIHTCLDTSGITFDPDDPERLAKFDRLLDATDLVLLDVKHIDDEEHRKLTGHSNRNVLAFLSCLAERGQEVWVRHVVDPGITLEDRWLEALGEHLGAFSNVKALDVLPYHDMGRVKYEALGIPYPLGDTPTATKEDALHARAVILDGMKKTRFYQKP
ncbi:MAG: pyruvate formate lyase-activating protein [Clostridia bacterium]|nr:pyruvate formate lyase-activating protein [Clostridia bacterium]